VRSSTGLPLGIDTHQMMYSTAETYFCVSVLWFGVESTVLTDSSPNCWLQNCVLTVLRLRLGSAGSPSATNLLNYICCACVYNRSAIVSHGQLKDCCASTVALLLLPRC
jgi:hypothetical protein